MSNPGPPGRGLSLVLIFRGARLRLNECRASSDKAWLTFPSFVGYVDKDILSTAEVASPCVGFI